MSTGTGEQAMGTETTIDPAEFDERLFKLYEQAGRLQGQLDTNRDLQHTAVGDRQQWIGKRQVWRRTAAEVLESLQLMAKHDEPLPLSISRAGQVTAASLLKDEGTLMTLQAGVMLAITTMDQTYAQPENRWPRYFRCLNADGHIHSSLRGCPTVRWDTAMGWNTHLSGQGVEAAIADLGPTLCSVCFPGAPAEHCRKKSDVDRAAREQARAAREEAKFAKQLRADEQFRTTGQFSERVTTVAACRDLIRKAVEAEAELEWINQPERERDMNADAGTLTRMRQNRAGRLAELTQDAGRAASVLMLREQRHEGHGATMEAIAKIRTNKEHSARKEWGI